LEIRLSKISNELSQANFDTGKASKSLLQKALRIEQLARRIGLQFPVQIYTGVAHREGAAHWV